MAEDTLSPVRAPHLSFCLLARPAPREPVQVLSAYVHSCASNDRLLRVVNRELREAEVQLDKLCMIIGECEATSGDCLRRRDVLILRSMPGIGRINLAALLCEASGPLGSRDYQALRTLCGAAPVTKQSGKSRVVVMRYAAHVRLRNTVYHWARVAGQCDPKCRARYAALRQRGHSHGRALRSVADRLLALACVLLRRRTLFDPHLTQAR